MNMDVKCGDINIMVKNLIDLIDGPRSSSSPSIYMALSKLRDLSPSSFKPLVVSIGPLHKKDENLQRFEDSKVKYVQYFLDHTVSRNKQSKTEILTACVDKVTASINKIKGCYADVKGYKDHELAEMMVKDACFILHVIRVILNLYGVYTSLPLGTYIYYDLLLLENQIPFFVLNDIYECTILQSEKHQSLTQFVLPFLRFPILFQREKVPVTILSYTDYDHILGVLHDCYKPSLFREPRFPKSTIRSAVELERARVKLISNKNADWPLAIDYVKMRRWWCTFWFLSEPTLKMPTLCMNQFTEQVFRNFIAYEQSSEGVPSYVTSYVKAMDMLVDTHEDIDVLVRSEVIINHLGSNEEAADMINGICKGGEWEEFYYSDEWEELDKYFTGYWSRKLVYLHLWMDNFRHTYFSSPWNIIALFAGIALFGLTLVQTIFAVKYAGK